MSKNNGAHSNEQPGDQPDEVENELPVIVVGASAGGLEALKKLVASLPKDFETPICIVWHMSPDVRGILPDILNKANTIYAANAYDNEPIKPNRIYVAPPDHHLVIEKGKLRVTRGPKENRFRPAVDPLFRSAAYEYGSKAIGIILSGALDDGTAGLWNIKQRGGTAIVQEPMDAEVSSMPESAIREVAVDFVVPVSAMAALLGHLAAKEHTKQAWQKSANDALLEKEISIALAENGIDTTIMELGNLTPFTCPECHGVLTMLQEGKIRHYRCHTGHAFTADSLLSALTENIEDSLWNAIRSVEESMMLLNHIGDHFAEGNQLKMAGLYFRKAKEAQSRAALVKQAVLQHEHVSKESVMQEANEDSITGNHV